MKTFLCIITMALVTYGIRALSLTLIRKKITSHFIRSLLSYLPYGVLAAMSFPAIMYCCESQLAAVCGSLCALILALLDQPLTMVALASALTVLAVSLLT